MADSAGGAQSPATFVNAAAKDPKPGGSVLIIDPAKIVTTKRTRATVPVSSKNTRIP